MRGVCGKNETTVGRADAAVEKGGEMVERGTRRGHFILTSAADDKTHRNVERAGSKVFTKPRRKQVLVTS